MYKNKSLMPYVMLYVFQEEKSRARLPAIWKKYKNLVRISLDEMQWMEKEILTTLKYIIYYLHR